MNTRSVSYDLEMHDDLPDRVTAQGAASPLEDQLQVIMWDEDRWAPRWARIGRYANAAAAAAAANTLRKRHGDTPEVEGWRFESRRIDGGDASGLFAQYDPDQIVPGRREQNAEQYKAYKKRQAEARLRRIEEKARKAAEVEADL